MDLRKIFDRTTLGYIVERGGFDETATGHVERYALLDYGTIYYVRNRREALWANAGLESRIDIRPDGNAIVYVDPSDINTYLRRWMGAKSPVKPRVSDDGSVYDVVRLNEETAVALLRATYCRPRSKG